MKKLVLIAAFAALGPTAMLAQETAPNVFYNYNMGTAEYFVGNSRATGFGFSCADNKDKTGQTIAGLGFHVANQPIMKGDTVAVSRDGVTISMMATGDDGWVDFKDPRGVEPFTKIWEMVRKGDLVDVKVNDLEPVRVATTGAAEVMPATPCGG